MPNDRIWQPAPLDAVFMKPPSILIAQDDAFMGSLLEFILGRQQWQTQLVRDGKAAVDLLDTAPAPDMVVLELMLPQLSGFEVLSRIKGHDDWCKVPVVALSAVDDGQVIAKAFREGIADHIARPFDPDELIARLRRLLPPARSASGRD